MSPRVRFVVPGSPDLALEVRAGTWLGAAAIRAGAPIVFDCDGQGVCATCAVAVESGGESLGPPDEEERAQLGARLDAGWRLACRVRVAGDLAVRLPPPGFAYPPELQPETAPSSSSRRPASASPTERITRPRSPDTAE